MDDLTRKEYAAPTVTSLDVSGEIGKGVPAFAEDASFYFSTSGVD